VQGQLAAGLDCSMRKVEVSATIIMVTLPRAEVTLRVRYQRTELEATVRRRGKLPAQSPKRRGNSFRRDARESRVCGEQKEARVGWEEGSQSPSQSSSQSRPMWVREASDE
jgi:hypothetical protein